MKKIIIIVTFIIIITIIFLSWWNNQLRLVSSEKQEKIIIITKGKSVSQIAKQLKDEGLINSELIFKLYTRVQRLNSKLSAGTFKLSPSMSTPQIVEALMDKPLEEWVTLIEGWRVEEMGEELSSKFQSLDFARNRLPSSKFLEVAREGYMFPDTYLFPPDVTVEQMVKKLRNNFEQKYSEDLKAKIRAHGLSENEGVILASIVEREARSDQARTDVASILLKRLKIGMGLNADATIQYALGYQPQEKSWWKRHLIREDLKVNSPYNTYLYKGLPPTPICNPGLASIKAVANADPNIPYLYYYHDSKGNSYYAKTLEEHNQNVANNP